MNPLRLAQEAVRRHPGRTGSLVLNSGLSLLLVGMVAYGCLKPVTPAETAQAADTAIECIEQNWGQPLGILAGNCFGAVLTAAEDGVASVEALLEINAPDAGVSSPAARFPYETPAIRAKIEARKTALLAKR